MWDFIANLLAGLGLLGAFFAWRASQLRREEVLSWGMAAVGHLQRLKLLTDSTSYQEEHASEVTRLSHEISVLVEQGRLFFRNADGDGHGAEKEEAYRGLRPAILDQLVFSYLIASAWSDLSAADRHEGTKIIVKCENRFVSLLQREVGRKRAADRYNMEGGVGYDLHGLLRLSRFGKFPVLPAERDTLPFRVRKFMRF